MKFCSAVVAVPALLAVAVQGFTVPSASMRTSRLQVMETEEETKQQEQAADPDAAAEDVEGLPWWWELVWKLDMMQKGEPGEDIIFGDTANVLRTNIEQIYGGYDSLDGCPLAEGELNDIADGTMFVGLQRYQVRYESPYKLCFGPKSFLVISDPIQAKHILRDANTNYDKVRKCPVPNCTRVEWGVSINFVRIGCFGRDFGAHHGQGFDPSRPQDVVGSSSSDCAGLSQGLVGAHGGFVWVLQWSVD